MMKYVRFLVLGLVVSLFSGCSDDEVAVERESRFEPFIKQYNRHIAEWLETTVASVREERVKLEKQLAGATDEAGRKVLEKKLADNQRVLEKYEGRIALKEFFSFKTVEDLPGDLEWENGDEQPIIGDPAAKKGGVYHTYILDFPPTLRPIGPNANNSFRGYLYDDIELSFTGIHPLTNQTIPALAKEWAIGADGKTVYYRLDPNATYSDGVRVKAKDFMMGMYIRLSNDISAPFEKQYYKEQFANITVYADDLISVTLPEPKPMMTYYTSLVPAAPHFYKEYGPDYDTRYQWRVPPTTGAYTLLDKDIKKGRSLTLSRVKDWWAKDKKFYKNAYNADKIVYTVIAEQSKAFELFRLGELDTFYLGQPSYWYEKMEIDEYFNGYIEKAQFYNEYPRVPRGFYFNVHQAPFDNADVRRGVAHALNFRKVNTIIFRGDSERMEQFSDGFGEFTNPDVKARRFSISKAEEYFAKAGYKERDNAGYLVNGKGKRLQLEITWSAHPLYDQMMTLLKEDAKKAGLEILLDKMNSTVSFRKIVEKRHKVAFTGWGVTPPTPRYFQFLHSTNAYDDKGGLKQQTNNIFSYKDARMDELVETVRFAKTKDELKRAAWEVQQIVNDEALFIPALKTSFVRLGYWRWVKWPQTKLYEFSSPTVYVPTDSYLYWIDEDLKKETLEAKKSGKKLEEKNHLFDLYRKGIPKVEALEEREIKSF